MFQDYQLKTAKDVAEALAYKHADYYETCGFGFIIEAVENTLQDLKIKGDYNRRFEEIHKNIIENYI